MARISTYDFDGTLSNTDKVIGTDSSDTATKNFKLQDLKEFIFSGISGPVTINSSGVSSVTFPDVTLGTDTSGSYVESLVAGDGIQLLNNSGEGATPTVKVNPLQTTITSILNTGLCVGRDSTDKICFTTDNQIRFTVNNALDLILAENSLTPGTSDGTALGTSSLMWSDLFLASGSVVNFNNGNVTVTHGDGVLQIDTDSKLEFRDNAIFINSSADGQLDIDADDEVEINSAKIDIDATGNGSDAIVIEATAGGIDVLASGASAGEDIDIIATGSSVNITSTENDASAIHLNASAGGINIDASSGDIDIDSSTVDMLTTSTMVLLSQSTTSLKGNTGATFGDDTKQIAFDGSGNVDFDAVTLDIDASSTMTLDGTGVSIDGTLDSNFTVTGSGKDLTLSVAGGGTQQLILNSAGTGSTNAIVINSSAGGLDIDAAAGASIDAVGIAINSGSGNLNLTTTGTLGVTANTLDVGLTDSSSITLTSSESGEDLTISQVGGNDSSIIIEAAGTGTDAIKLNASAGSIDIDSADNITVDAADNITLQSTSSDGVVSLISSVDTDSGQRGILIQANGDASVKTDIDVGNLDITASLASIDAAQINLGVQSGCAVDIGHATSETTVLDNFTVNGTFKINTSSNQITFPTSRGNNNQVLKTDGSGNLSFTNPSSGVTVADTSSSSHLPVVLQDGSDNLLDDEDGLTFQASTGLLKVNNLSPQSNDGGSLGATGSSYSDLFLANGGIIEFKAGTGNRSQITHIDGSSGTEGSLRLNGKTKLEFNDAQVSIASLDDGHLDLAADTEVQVVSPIVNIDASTRVDISGALTVGGTLTLDSVGITNIQTSAEAFTDSDAFLMTAKAIDDRINSAQSMGSGFVLEDDSGDEVTITENKEVKFIGSGGLTINWTDTDNGTDGDPYDLTFTIGTLNQDTTGNAATATKFASAANIGGVAFDGSSNIDLPGVNTTGDQNTTGSAATLTTARTIGGVSFDGSSNINLPGVNTPGDQNTSGTAALATQFTVSANNSTDEIVFPVFVDGATGSQGAETDTGLFYNPSTGKLTSESFTSKANTNSKGGVINLSTTDTAITAGEILGTIEFQAPDEANGNDASLVAAEIRAVAEETFNDSSNDTKFQFITSRGTAITSSTSPVATISSIGQLVLDTPASGVLQTRSIKSTSTNTSGHYIEINSTQSGGTGGSLVIGVAGGANRIFSYDNTGSASSTRKFEIVTNGSDTANFVFNTNGDLEAGSYSTTSDKKLKSEIEPIREGLNVIKQFSSYTYIKGGEKESGFIAQEVKEAIPHTVYENNEGYLCMSDRGVLAHMHKAILEIDKRLKAIEDKIKK